MNGPVLIEVSDVLEHDNSRKADAINLAVAESVAAALDELTVDRTWRWHLTGAGARSARPWT